MNIRFGASIRGILLVVIFLALVVAGCAVLMDVLGEPTESEAITSLPTQSGWTPHPENPIVQVGDLVPRGIWNDPSVLKEDDQYVIYATTSVSEPFEPPVVPFRMVSDDGVNWSLDPEDPLLMPGDRPYQSIETPSVVKFNGKYHMYFARVYGMDTVPIFEIGHAISPDGKNWTIEHEDPVIRATGDVTDWNGYAVSEPGAVVFNDRLYLYFVAIGERPGGKQPPQRQVIAVATSADGVEFDEPKIVIEQIDTFPPERGFNGYSCPDPVLHNGRIHLFYNVCYYNRSIRPGWHQVALHHAVSEDGYEFKQDRKPIFRRSDFKWTRGGIIGPSALIEDDTVKMWFAGHMWQSDFGAVTARGWRGPEFGLGLATIPLKSLMQQKRK